jgi:hypothetical protein
MQRSSVGEVTNLHDVANSEPTAFAEALTRPRSVGLTRPRNPHRVISARFATWVREHKHRQQL